LFRKKRKKKNSLGRIRNEMKKIEDMGMLLDGKNKNDSFKLSCI
jgi:hypothetical protein